MAARATVPPPPQRNPIEVSVDRTNRDTGALPPVLHGSLGSNNESKACREKGGGAEEKEEEKKEVVVSLGLLRTCFSERYGSHIPR